MTSLESNAAWLDGVGQQLRVGPIQIRKPSQGEVLIKNHAVALNPVDVKMQTSGMLVQSWPTILGSDLAGEVVEVGDGVIAVKPGTRVLAHATGLLTGKPENSCFQDYTIVQAESLCPIPDHVPFEDAAVIPMAFSTAVGGLYPKEYLALPLPGPQPEKLGKTLLVWSGSSSVGSAVIQLAAASGLDVVATASPKNFDYCKSLGARDVLDYGSKNIVAELIERLQDVKLVGAFDAFGSKESTHSIAEVLSRTNGTFIATVEQPPEDLPGNIQAKLMLAALVPGTDVGKVLYAHFLPAALANGKYKAAPSPIIVGEGLESIQAGLDRLRQGVSASKVVVKL